MAPFANTLSGHLNGLQTRGFLHRLHQQKSRFFEKWCENNVEIKFQVVVNNNSFSEKNVYQNSKIEYTSI